MSNHAGVLHPLQLRQAIDAVGIRVERGCRRERRRSGMAGQIGHEQPVPVCEQRHDPGPVRRSAPEAVDEDHRRPLAADVVAHPHVLDLRGALLQNA
jgi:hypothetical protein